MKKIDTFIKSGIIELYVLGLASNDEIAEVEMMAATHLAVKQSIGHFCDALEKQGLANAVQPPAAVKTFVMASIDFMERLQGGEQPSFPPEMNETSKIIDFAEWLNRPDMLPPPHFEDMYAKIIGHSQKIITAIVWLKSMAPQEVHTDEFERFLIVEGTCNITIGKTVYHLTGGDYLAIPLFQNHHVVVTSAISCKVILQRVAA